MPNIERLAPTHDYLKHWDKEYPFATEPLQQALGKIQANHDTQLSREAINPLMEQFSPEDRQNLAAYLTNSVFNTVQNPTLAEKFLTHTYHQPYKEPQITPELLEILLGNDLPQSVQDLLLGYFDNYFAHHHDQWTQKHIYTFHQCVLEVVAVAGHLDRTTTQGKLLEYTFSDNELQKVMAEASSLILEFASDDEIVDPKTNQFLYWGKPIILNEDIPGAFKAREVNSRGLLLLEDKEGNALTLLKIDPVKSESDLVWEGEPLPTEDLKKYREYDFSLDEIQQILNSNSIHEIISLNEKYPELPRRPISPLVEDRLSKIFQKNKRLDLFQRIARRAYGHIEQICGFMDQTQIINFLDKVGAHYDLDNFNHVTGLFLAELSTVLFYLNNNSPNAVNLIDYRQETEELLATYLKEIADIKGPSINILSALSAIVLFSHTIHIGHKLRTDGKTKLPQYELHYHPDIAKFVSNDLERFINDNPDLEAIPRMLYDGVIAYDALVESGSPLLDVIKRDKVHFYQALAESGYMEKNPLDTRDIDRTMTAILKEIKEGRLPNQLRIALLGPNKAERFEAALIERLRAEGINIEEIFAIDFLDRSEFFPESLKKENITMITGDLTDSNLHKQIPTRSHVVVAPWSLMEEFFKKRDYLNVINNIDRMLELGGFLIFDTTLPVGKNSDEAELQRQDNRSIALLRDEFTLDEKKFVSYFLTLRPLDQWFILTAANIRPTNLPQALHQVTRLTTRIRLLENQLRINHELELDTDPHENFAWSTGKRNRQTIIGRKETNTGMPPSLFYKILFNEGK